MVAERYIGRAPISRPYRPELELISEQPGSRPAMPKHSAATGLSGPTQQSTNLPASDSAAVATQVLQERGIQAGAYQFLFGPTLYPERDYCVQY